MGADRFKELRNRTFPTLLLLLTSAPLSNQGWADEPTGPEDAQAILITGAGGKLEVAIGAGNLAGQEGGVSAGGQLELHGVLKDENLVAGVDNTSSLTAGIGRNLTADQPAQPTVAFSPVDLDARVLGTPKGRGCGFAAGGNLHTHLGAATVLAKRVDNSWVAGRVGPALGMVCAVDGVIATVLPVQGFLGARVRVDESTEGFYGTQAEAVVTTPKVHIQGKLALERSSTDQLDGEEPETLADTVSGRVRILGKVPGDVLVGASVEVGSRWEKTGGGETLQQTEGRTSLVVGGAF